ncbi:MAG: hypothetical protein ABI640_20220 [Gammaproteobacteria bacterium]
MRVLTSLGTLCACFAISASAFAEMTPIDLQIAARALSFMERPLSGAIRVGILYAPDNPRSVREAEALRDLLGAGVKAGKLELQPSLVGIREAAAAKVDLFFLAGFVGPAEANAAGISALKVPCVTTDIAQVEGGACLMGVRSSPKVQIMINRAAAKNSGITFATVFRVMITEI